MILYRFLEMINPDLTGIHNSCGFDKKHMAAVCWKRAIVW